MKVRGPYVTTQPGAPFINQDGTPADVRTPEVSIDYRCELITCIEFDGDECVCEVSTTQAAQLRIDPKYVVE